MHSRTLSSRIDFWIRSVRPADLWKTNLHLWPHGQWKNEHYRAVSAGIQRLDTGALCRRGGRPCHFGLRSAGAPPGGNRPGRRHRSTLDPMSPSLRDGGRRVGSSMLDLRLDERSGVYAAPLQMKATEWNSADRHFGRQRMSPGATSSTAGSCRSTGTWTIFSLKSYGFRLFKSPLNCCWHLQRT